MKVHNLRLDAKESVFFETQLEHLKAKSYDKKYPAIKARMVLPVDFESNAGAETIAYETYDHVGMAKIISNYAEDAPRADIRGEKHAVVVKDIGTSFGYNVKEIRAAAMAGKPLQQRRSNASREAQLRKERDIAFFGDKEHGLLGFINHPNISEFTVPATGDGSAKTWASKDAAKILTDLDGLVSHIITTTKGVEEPDTMLLPLSRHRLISTMNAGTGTDTTILQYFLKNNPFIQSVGWLNELETAGEGGTARFMAYKRDPDKLTLEIPAELEYLPPQERNYEYVVNGLSSCGGVIIYYPLSVAFGDGI